jgi:hypothetical protein
MHKHPTHLIAFDAKTTGPTRSWYSVFKDWGEAARLRREERKRSEVASQLTPSVLYDIGESDCKPWPSGAGSWDHHPYRLLMDTVMRRHPSEFDPRR